MVRLTQSMYRSHLRHNLFQFLNIVLRESTVFDGDTLYWTLKLLPPPEQSQEHRSKIDVFKEVNTLQRSAWRFGRGLRTPSSSMLLPSASNSARDMHFTSRAGLVYFEHIHLVHREAIHIADVDSGKI